MAFLDTLPEPVENRLRELRSQIPDSHSGTNGHSHAETTPAPRNGHTASNGAVAVLEPETRTEIAFETANQSDDAQDERILFETDINAKGVFGTEWLVVENGQIYVFAPGNANRAELRLAVPLAEVKKAKADSFIGNGLLEVQTAEETIALVRFSQANVGEANSIARQITGLAKGEGLKREDIEAKKKTCPKCRRVLPEDSEVCPACVSKRAVMLRLFQFLAPYKLLAVASVGVLLGNAVLDLLPPYLGGRIVDALTNTATNPTRSLTPVTIMVGLMILARIVGGGLQYAQRRLNAWLGAKILMDIRVAIYEKFNTLSLGYFDKRSVGSVMSRVTSDSDNLWDFLTDGVPWFISTILTFFGIGFVLFRLNWQLALLMLTPGPLIFALTRWFLPRAVSGGRWCISASTKCTPPWAVRSTECASSKPLHRKTAKTPASSKKQQCLSGQLRRQRNVGHLLAAHGTAHGTRLVDYLALRRQSSPARNPYHRNADYVQRLPRAVLRPVPELLPYDGLDDALRHCRRARL